MSCTILNPSPPPPNPSDALRATLKLLRIGVIAVHPGHPCDDPHCPFRFHGPPPSAVAPRPTPLADELREAAAKLRKALGIESPTTAQKWAYVREQAKEEAIEHFCHAIGCKDPVPPAYLMCPRHWARVPKPLRDAVIQAFRPGQEKEKNPSQAYLDAAKAAIEAVEALLRETERPQLTLFK